jgi:hypothetical protein
MSFRNKTKKGSGPIIKKTRDDNLKNCKRKYSNKDICGKPDMMVPSKTEEALAGYLKAKSENNSEEMKRYTKFIKFIKTDI